MVGFACAIACEPGLVVGFLFSGDEQDRLPLPLYRFYKVASFGMGRSESVEPIGIFPIDQLNLYRA